MKNLKLTMMVSGNSRYKAPVASKLDFGGKKTGSIVLVDSKDCFLLLSVVLST